MKGFFAWLRENVPTAVIVVLLVVIAVGYAWLGIIHSRNLAALEEETEERIAENRLVASRMARELSEDLTRVVAIAAAVNVAAGEVGRLEAELGAMVRGHRLAAVIVLDRTGRVLASTDRRWAGRTLDDPLTLHALTVTEVGPAPEAPAPGQLEIHAPLLVGAQQVGALRVAVDLGDLADSR